MNQIDSCLAKFQLQFTELQAKHPNYDILANSGNFSNKDNAKTNLTFAFALNSLFYSTLRMTQTDHPAEVKTHPVHSQIKIVRDHFVKLDNATHNRRIQKEETKEGEVVHRIVERTVNENKRIINKQ